ncbi:MAG: hypothetical protein K2G03_04075 [Bacilli bacterium]|nr:hypothetical protein [Bacilli bacterium]
MKTRKIGIIVALLILTVAFASVTTTLVLTGTLSIGTDRSSFDADVAFTDSVTILGGEYSLSQGNKTLEFKTAHLNMLESETTLSFEVRNNSRQYDAKANINCTPIDPVYEDYVSVDVTPLSSFELNALETQSGTIKVKLTRSITGDAAEIPFECKITAEAVERDSLQKDPSRFVANDASLAVGSEVCLDEECFKVINNAENTLTMIADYNVNKDTYIQSSLASGVAYDEKVSEILDGYLAYLTTLTRAKNDSSIQISLLTKESLTSTYGCSNTDEGLSCVNSSHAPWLITSQEYYLQANEAEAKYESIDINGLVVNSNNGGVRPIITISKTLLKQAG